MSEIVNQEEKLSLVIKDKFTFFVKAFPQLEKLVFHVDWGQIDKVLRITAQENVNLDIYNWVQSIQDKNKEMQKSSFVNTDANNITLTIRNDSDEEIGRFLFKGLNVRHSYCYFYKSHLAIDNNSRDQAVCYNVEIEYENVELIRNKP